MSFSPRSAGLALTIIGSNLLVLPIWRDLSFAPRLILLSVALPLLCYSLRPSLSGLLLCGMAGLSLLWAPIAPEGMNGLWWAGLLLLGLSLGENLSKENLEFSLTLFAICVGANVIIAALQYAGLFHQILAVDVQAAGTYVNRNFLGEAAALATVWCAGQRAWALGGLCLLGVVLSQSFSAFGATAFGLLLLWLPLWLAGGLSLVAVVAMLAGHSAGLEARLLLWRAALDGSSLWGHGIGQFYSMFPYYAADTVAYRHDNAHNLLIGLFFELGLPGLIWGLAVGILAWTGAGKSYRPMLGTLFALSTVGFPLYVPSTLFIGTLFLGLGISGRSRLWGIGDSRPQPVRGGTPAERSGLAAPGGRDISTEL